MLSVSARQAIKLVRLLTFAAGRQGLRYGVAAGVEHWRALGGLGVATVVDVGANKGQFALLAIGAFPGATIYCFEPLKEPAARLRKMLGAEVRLFETAIGSSERKGIIYVSRRPDASSLLPITKQSEIFPGTELTEERVVPIARLTKYLSSEDLKPPALLKIDVQGYELEVLKGCDPLLSLFQFVYLESSFIELYQGQVLAAEVILYLVHRNFQLSGIYNQVVDSTRRPVQADFLFTKMRHLADTTQACVALSEIRGEREPDEAFRDHCEL
jgi:FkbM family methyltransferase